MTSKILPIKGTRDFYPEEMAVRTFIYQTARKVSESFGYQEFDSPFLEPFELYAAKSGDELVKEQSFVFKDRSNELVVLRPELTPSLARMVAQRQKQLVYPLRWWSWGPFWRYEKPQKGRSREFFQWNIDLIGVDSSQADAEMIAISAGFLKESGLTPDQVQVLVNNRQLMVSQLENLQISPELHVQVFRLIDRRDKLPVQEWESYGTQIGLSDYQFQGVKNLLADHNLWQRSPVLTQVFNLLEGLEIADYVRFAPFIIRGLDYYTGTVFEVWDVDGEFRAILGGGRYDNLVEAVGGTPLPAIGFAMGDVVISLVLKKFGCLHREKISDSTQILVTVFNQDSQKNAFKFASELRNHDLKVICYPSADRLNKQLKFADRIGARIAVILGPDEINSNTVGIKNLQSGNQVTIPAQDAVNKIKSMLLDGD